MTRKYQKQDRPKDPPPNGLPSNPIEYTPVQRASVVKWLASNHTLAELRHRQRIADQSMVLASKKEDARAWDRCNAMWDMATGAIDLKVFG